MRPKLEVFLQQFTNNGQITTDDLAEQIMQRTRQCWVVADEDIRAVVLTQLDTDRTKTFRITHLAGVGLREWDHLFPQLEEWARSQGSTRLEALARRGYERVGERYGLKSTHVMLEKEL